MKANINKTIYNQFCKHGFTLVEMLVVMSIIMIMASMMLPSLTRAKEKAKTITCVNNLHQLGLAMRMYVDEHNGKYPNNRVFDTGDQRWKNLRPAPGGFDPLASYSAQFPPARLRPLNAYVAAGPVYRCPVDRGQRRLVCPEVTPKQPNFISVGCSYQYNAGGLIVLKEGGFRKPVEDEEKGISGKPEGWVPTPSKYILMHEPPARIYGCSSHGPEWHQWHYVRGPSDIEDATVARRDFMSPVLFADGHSAYLNFSRALMDDPYYPYEETKDWIWYKPASKTTPNQSPDKPSADTSATTQQ